MDVEGVDAENGSDGEQKKDESRLRESVEGTEILVITNTRHSFKSDIYCIPSVCFFQFKKSTFNYDEKWLINRIPFVTHICESCLRP